MAKVSIENKIIKDLFEVSFKFEKDDYMRVDLKLPTLVLQPNWMDANLLVLEVLSSRLNRQKGWLYDKNISLVYFFDQNEKNLMAVRAELEALVADKCKSKEFVKSPQCNKLMASGDKVIAFISKDDVNNLLKT